jgi:hypothetical protein
VDRHHVIKWLGGQTCTCEPAFRSRVKRALTYYVAAWHLSGLVAAHGNSWTTIARYHSATPSRNHRYQLLRAREPVAAGVLAANRIPVGRPASPAFTGTGVDAGPDANAVVLDDTMGLLLP